MAKTSAGLLMYKLGENGELYIFLAHPGGPYYQNKQLAVWGIPKGLVEEGEDLLEAAQREFVEETGILPSAPFVELGHIRYKKGKEVFVWSFEGRWKQEEGIKSNSFTAEWPPKSGRVQEFPEIDEARWMELEEIKIRIHPAQWPLVLRLYEHLAQQGLLSLPQLPIEL